VYVYAGGGVGGTAKRRGSRVARGRAEARLSVAVIWAGGASGTVQASAGTQTNVRLRG
jgi:hypothetical protein